MSPSPFVPLSLRPSISLPPPTDSSNCEKRAWRIAYTGRDPNQPRLWPLMSTVSEWCAFIDRAIGVAYALALDAYPHPREAARPPPSADTVRAAITPLAHWFHLSGDSSRSYPRQRRPRIDVKAALGEFYPASRAGRASKAADALAAPMGRMELAPRARQPMAGLPLAQHASGKPHGAPNPSFFASASR